jgi:hypothetical protein
MTRLLKHGRLPWYCIAPFYAVNIIAACVTPPAPRPVPQESAKGEGPMSVYTVELPAPDAPSRVQPGIGAFQPNDANYQLAVIRFEDSGAASDLRELPLAVECIEQARNAPNGAVVMVFIHGWHHNAEWDIDTDTGDKHFAAFRQVLKALTLREAERYDATGPKGRRIVGVYVGWNGDPPGSLLPSLGFLTHASFWDRGKTAETIGGGADLRNALAKIFTATKAPNQAIATESPLILVGHSMGALILESAFLALLKDPAHPLAFDVPAGRPNPRPVEILRDGKPILFPDVLLALNSAADSAIFRRIREELAQRGIVKTIRANGPAYAPPLLISATSPTTTPAGSGPWPRDRGPAERPRATTRRSSLTTSPSCRSRSGAIPGTSGWTSDRTGIACVRRRMRAGAGRHSRSIYRRESATASRTVRCPTRATAWLRERHTRRTWAGCSSSPATSLPITTTSSTRAQARSCWA